MRSQPTNKPSIVYKYIYSGTLQLRINEKIVDKLVAVYINDYIESQVVENVRDKIVKLKRLDGRLKLLDKMFLEGIINHDYYESERMLHEQKTDYSINSLRLVNHGFQKWETMENNQKREFLLSYVEKIIIDMYKKEVVEIIFVDYKQVISN
ncbi:hypothetical protein [Erysipelothrix aquatica]|uniref:hypothetical protein n=1 Tax=Erysipelothrix aquatica TaxID=2683714 RepID=UPI001359EF54|nr:hypothetical protein [Erysipelothrix aquatica]